jgi:site-specific DNA recombinase
MHEGWRLIPHRFDDGGLSGASLERPALQALLELVRARKIDIVVVYKVDRLTRSLADFAKLVELFDESEVSFVSVTLSFNTSTSMGRLTLNVLLSFAQFEREVIGERVRDKIAASKKKGRFRWAIAAGIKSWKSCLRKRRWSSRSFGTICVSDRSANLLPH